MGCQGFFSFSDLIWSDLCGWPDQAASEALSLGLIGVGFAWGNLAEELIRDSEGTGKKPDMNTG